jgi:hypothetical protein
MLCKLLPGEECAWYERSEEKRMGGEGWGLPEEMIPQSGPRRPSMSTSLCSVRLPPDQVGLTITGQRHGGVSAAKAVEINGLVAKLRAVHGPGRFYQSPGRSLIARAVHH